MGISRRVFAKGLLVAGGMVSFLGILPKSLMAAWNNDAFNASNLQDAMKSYYGSGTTEASDKIKITAPSIAENGAVVPISVSSSIEGAESITIFVEKNPQPLIASFVLHKANQNVSTRIKMAKTSNVYAVVLAKGKIYEAHQEVKVTIGGCGG